MLEVVLEDGGRAGLPDGHVLAVDDNCSPILITGNGVPEGMVARYRPTRRRDDQGRRIYRFREWDQIVARVPGGEG